MKTQVKLVYALTALHNFMNWKGDNPVAIAKEIERDERRERLRRDVHSLQPKEEAINVSSSEDVNARRDVIAEMMWQSYIEHVRALDNSE